jgi:hypothetical protein
VNSGQGKAGKEENNDSRNAGSFVQKHTSEQMRFEPEKNGLRAKQRPFDSDAGRFRNG